MALYSCIGAQCSVRTTNSRDIKFGHGGSIVYSCYAIATSIIHINHILVHSIHFALTLTMTLSIAPGYEMVTLGLFGFDVLIT